MPPESLEIDNRNPLPGREKLLDSWPKTIPIRRLIIILWNWIWGMYDLNVVPLLIVDAIMILFSPSQMFSFKWYDSVCQRSCVSRFTSLFHTPPPDFMLQISGVSIQKRSLQRMTCHFHCSIPHFFSNRPIANIGTSSKELAHVKRTRSKGPFKTSLRKYTDLKGFHPDYRSMRSLIFTRNQLQEVQKKPTTNHHLNAFSPNIFFPAMFPSPLWIRLDAPVLAAPAR